MIRIVSYLLSRSNENMVKLFFTHQKVEEGFQIVGAGFLMEEEDFLILVGVHFVFVLGVAEILSYK